LVSENSVVDVSFARIAGEHARALMADRERLLKRSAAWVAVLLIHVLFVAALLVAGRVNVVRLVIPVEMPIYIATLHPKEEAQPEKVLPKETPALPAPITVPPTFFQAAPLTPETTGNPSLALGKSLKCGAGSFEYLTPAEQKVCLREPWRFKKDSNSIITLDVPPTERPVTGAEAAEHTRQTADPCLAADSTGTFCIHKTIFGDKPQ
jgi:hypothetical protein